MALTFCKLIQSLYDPLNAKKFEVVWNSQDSGNEGWYEDIKGKKKKELFMLTDLPERDLNKCLIEKGWTG